MRDGVVRILQSLIAGKGGGEKSDKFHFDTTNIPPLPPNQPKTIVMTNTDRSFTFTRIWIRSMQKSSYKVISLPAGKFFFRRNHRTWISNNSPFWPNHCGQFWSRHRTILGTLKLHHQLNFPSSTIVLEKPFHRHRPCNLHQTRLDFPMELLKYVQFFVHSWGIFLSMSNNSTSSGSPSLTAKKTRHGIFWDSSKVDDDGEGNTPQINDS